MNFFEIKFDEIDFVKTIKHEFYRLYQTNKNLKMFLNIFLRFHQKN